MTDSKDQMQIENSTEFSSIKSLSGRVQNKRQAINAVLLYTHIINFKSIANWILFGLTIFFSIAFIILVGVLQNYVFMYVSQETVKANAKIFLLTWIILNSIWILAISIKHSIMYFAQTKDNGSELLIVSKPVTRKILYWTRILYLLIYLSIYSFIIFFTNIIFCVSIGFSFIPINVVAFIFATPFVYIFFGMIIMSITLFACILTSTKNVNTIASLTSFLAITLFSSTSSISQLAKYNYESTINGNWEYLVNDKLGIDYSQYNQSMNELKTAIYKKIITDLKNEYNDKVFTFTYNQSDIEQTKTFYGKNISLISFTNPNAYEENGNLNLKWIDFTGTNSMFPPTPENQLELSNDYNFDFDGFKITKWITGQKDLYDLANSANQKVYKYFKSWLDGTMSNLIDSESLITDDNVNYLNIKMIAEFAKEQLSYSNLNKYAGWATMDYFNFFSIPSKFFGFDNVSLFNDSYSPNAQENSKLNYGFDWSTLYMPDIIPEKVESRDSPTLTITKYRLVNNKLPEQSPGWAIALFWSSIATSSLFSSYYLFKKKDFR